MKNFRIHIRRGNNGRDDCFRVFLCKNFISVSNESKLCLHDLGDCV